jgi:hypothetical protein
VLIAVIAGAGCGGSGEPATAHRARPTSPPASPSLLPSPTPKQTPKPTAVEPAVACQSRPAGDEIFVRYITTDEPPTAIRLGGGWVWNFGDKKCVTSVEFALASNPQLDGFCTEVGYASANAGYDPDARPAPRLRRIAARRGDC